MGLKDPVVGEMPILVNSKKNSKWGARMVQNPTISKPEFHIQYQLATQ